MFYGNVACNVINFAKKYNLHLKCSKSGGKKILVVSCGWMHSVDISVEKFN